MAWAVAVEAGVAVGAGAGAAVGAGAERDGEREIAETAGPIDTGTTAVQVQVSRTNLKG